LDALALHGHFEDKGSRELEDEALGAWAIEARSFFVGFGV